MYDWIRSLLFRNFAWVKVVTIDVFLEALTAYIPFLIRDLVIQGALRRGEVFLLMILFLFRQGLFLVRDYTSVHWVETLILELKRLLFERYFGRSGLGGVSRDRWVIFTKDVDAIRSFFLNSFLPALNAFVTVLVVGLVFVFTYSSLSFILVPLFFGFLLLYRWFTSALMERYRQIRSLLGEFMSALESIFSHWLEVWFYDLVRSLRSLVFSLFSREKEVRKEFFVLSSFLQVFSDSLMFGGGILIICLFLYQTRSLESARYNLADLLVVYMLFSYLSGAILRLTRLGPGFSRFSVAWKKLRSFVVDQGDSKERESGFVSREDLPRRPWKVELNDLTVGFRDKVLFSGLSLTLSRGGILLITGKNGSGKTTFLKTVIGLVKPIRGEVRIEGRRVTEKLIAENRDKISLVLDTGFWFEGTVRENILAVCPGVAEEEICSLMRFFSLDLALDYEIVSLGENLSLGQKRKLEIIRALLRRPSLCIIDEIFLGLDEISRQRLIEKLREMKGSVSFIITANFTLPELISVAEEVICLR